MDALHRDLDHEAMIYMLLNKGADIEERTVRGETLLHSSVTSVVRVRAILQRLQHRQKGNFGIDNRDEKGRTALHYAAAAYSSRVMHFLVSHGADILAKDNKQVTTLHFAVRDPSCVRIAVEGGCDVDSFDNLHRTPYHYAFLFEGPKAKVVSIIENTLGVKLGAVDI